MPEATMRPRRPMVRFVARWWWMILAAAAALAALPLWEFVTISRARSGALVERVAADESAVLIDSRMVVAGRSHPSGKYMIFRGAGGMVLYDRADPKRSFRFRPRDSKTFLTSLLVDETSGLAYLLVGVEIPLLPLPAEFSARGALLAWRLEDALPREAAILPAPMTIAQYDRSGERLLLRGLFEARTASFHVLRRSMRAQGPWWLEFDLAAMKPRHLLSGHQYVMREGAGLLSFDFTGFRLIDGANARELEIGAFVRFLWSGEIDASPIVGDRALLIWSSYDDAPKFRKQLTLISDRVADAGAADSVDLFDTPMNDGDLRGTSTRIAGRDAAAVYFHRSGSGTAPGTVIRFNVEAKSFDVVPLPAWCGYVEYAGEGVLLLASGAGRRMLVPFDEIDPQVPAP